MSSESEPKSPESEGENRESFGKLPHRPPPGPLSQPLRFSVGLIAVAVIIFLGLGFFLAGPNGVIPVLLWFVVQALVTTITAVAARMIVGQFFGVSFLARLRKQSLSCRR